MSKSQQETNTNKRTERLPNGWQWVGPMKVRNGDVIVYLTSGIRGDDAVARHIGEVMKKRDSAGVW